MVNIPPPDSKDIDSSYQQFCNAILDAAKHSIPRGCGKQYIPGWSDETLQLYEELFQPATLQESKKAANNSIENLNRKRHN